MAVDKLLTSIERQNITLSFLVEEATPAVFPWDLRWLYFSSPLLTPYGGGGEDITNVSNRTLTSSFSFSAFVNSTSISLTISNVLLRGPSGGLTDEGRYFLVATNPAGSNFDYIDLVFTGMPCTHVDCRDLLEQSALK